MRACAWCTAKSPAKTPPRASRRSHFVSFIFVYPASPSSPFGDAHSADASCPSWRGLGRIFPRPFIYIRKSDKSRAGLMAFCGACVFCAPDDDVVSCKTFWRNGRVVEGTCLENKQGASSRGFKSYFLRHAFRPRRAFRAAGFSFSHAFVFSDADDPPRHRAPPSTFFHRPASISYRGPMHAEGGRI